jgi:hypothetical protein
VDRWASASLPTTAVGDSNDANGDDDDFDYDDEDSYMSLRDTESGRSRRRLPPTPMKGAVSSNGGTDDCLQVHKDNFGYITNKKARRLFVFCKIQQIFQIVFLTKIYSKKLQKSCQLAAPKNLCRKLFCFTGKICLY